jgi:murein L,D-transpeptidase YafK
MLLKIKVTKMKNKMLIILLISLFLVGFTRIYNSGIKKGDVIDYIEVHKEDREMMVYSNGELLKTYDIALGFRPDGKKHFQGDGKTPEGVYYINDKNPNSIAHKNLGVSYPNSEDINYARDNGTSPGGDIKIHGLMRRWEKFGMFHKYVDWTGGCIAVTNPEMDELYKHTKIGAKIKIFR